VALRINRTYRYRNEPDGHLEVVDGFPNFYAATLTEDNLKGARLNKGISQMAQRGPAGSRRHPAILIYSSPRKAGSKKTPWKDSFDLDRGRIRYFGDAKVEHMPDPFSAGGNKVLKAQYDLYNAHDRESRLKASPLLFFVSNRSGYAEFKGFGLIESMELVPQVDLISGAAFSNCAYDCSLFDLANEGEELDWNWISARKDASIPLEESNELAPKSWQTWVKEGSTALPKIRRVVARVGSIKTEDQLPVEGSREERVLKEVFDFYSSDISKKKRFEALAQRVAFHVINDAGRSNYQLGWITPGGGDGGVDFVGRLDVGRGFSQTSLVVLGQAKCLKSSAATTAEDLARTVARLKRGWIGCFVTTSTFSKKAQEEVIEDRYPMILVAGVQVARAVDEMARDAGTSVMDLLLQIDAGYEDAVKNRNPEQILL